jgi:heavy metal sensor kinase
VVRYVTLKVPQARTRQFWGLFGSPPSARGGNANGPRFSSGRSPPRPVTEFDTPPFYIQYARDTDRLHSMLAQFQKDYENDLHGLRAETQESLASLRTRLILVSLVTFGLTALGGAVLGHRGLLPLQRIAEAVSHVSHKDFQLRLGIQRIPAELVPIVDKLRNSFASLSRAFAYEKQAVADISHELRTPIASLLTTIQVCLRKPRDSEEYRAALQTCRDVGQHLNTLVERLLMLARLDAGVDAVQVETVNVAELAEQCLDMVRPLAEAKGLTVRCDAEGAVYAETDASKLREIVLNLLDNAVTYNREHGCIELRVRVEHGRVVLEVSDTGAGIPPEARPHLFDRFYRADPSRQTSTGNTGLGLAIVKGYLDLLGGTIGVESQEEIGSTFRVTLPVAAGRFTPAGELVLVQRV